MDRATLRIERLSRLEDFRACFELQMATWKYAAGEELSPRVFLMADRLGGQVLGAFDGDRLIGFNLGLPAARDGRAYLHSQMLAVAPEYRNTGVGRGLKLRQREVALTQGYDLIEWTFDPLEIKNAYFNLVRLGAISRRYYRDFYGPSTSPLQGGLPTDRLYAEWWIQSERVQRVVRGEPCTCHPERHVEVPGDVYAWKAHAGTQALAMRAQEQVRDGLEAAFADGLAATAYERMEDGSGRYILSSYDPKSGGVEGNG